MRDDHGAQLQKYTSAELILVLARERFLRDEYMRQVEANNREIELLQQQHAKLVELLRLEKERLLEASAP